MVQRRKNVVKAVVEQPKVYPKPISWRGSSLDDLKQFGEAVCREAGFQLNQIQYGLEPAHYKPFNTVGAGVVELIVDVADGWYRVIYLAKFEEAVYVLHCFKKKTNETSKKDKDIASARFKDVIKER